MDLMGAQQESTPWPCQRDDVIEWYARLGSTGPLDIKGLLQIDLVRAIMLRCVCLLLWPYLGPDVRLACYLCLPTRLQTARENLIEESQGRSARLEEQDRWDSTIERVWGVRARQKRATRYGRYEAKTVKLDKPTTVKEDWMDVVSGPGSSEAAFTLKACGLEK